jgi:hypothetical protein
VHDPPSKESNYVLDAVGSGDRDHGIPVYLLL